MDAGINIRTIEIPRKIQNKILPIMYIKDTPKKYILPPGRVFSQEGTNNFSSRNDHFKRRAKKPDKPRSSFIPKPLSNG